ncbi:MAG TPA: hypothetical protein VGR94_02450 [Candidatus Acidoferrales bacterium]|nr:hypothetical protein [Candidatus Acidoferrales bacterium]
MLASASSTRLSCRAVFATATAALLLPLASVLFGMARHAQEKPKTRPGYCRFPAIHGDTVIFTAEGDLCTVRAEGGVAHRLTSDAGMEDDAAISPDGKMVAFSAQYEGP